MVKNLPQCRSRRKHRFDPWVETIPWRRKWQPTLIFLPGEPRGQRSLAGYSPCGRKESDTTSDLAAASLYIVYFSLLKIKMNIYDSVNEHKGKWKVYTKVLFWWG